MRYNININCNRVTTQEIISRVYQRKETAEKELQQFNDKKLVVPFKSYIKSNDSKTGFYVCFFSSTNKDRIKEWLDWLHSKDVECFLVRT